MKLIKLRKGSRAEKILSLLYKEGPMSRGELAEAMDIEPIEYKFDIEELRKQQVQGVRKSPPRRNTKVYPYLPGTLSYMSRADYKSKWTGTKEQFSDFYKPLIVLNEGKWEITDWGVRALINLNEEPVDV